MEMESQVFVAVAAPIGAKQFAREGVLLRCFVAKSE